MWGFFDIKEMGSLLGRKDFDIGGRIEGVECCELDFFWIIFRSESNLSNSYK